MFLNDLFQMVHYEKQDNALDYDLDLNYIYFGGIKISMIKHVDMRII